MKKTFVFFVALIFLFATVSVAFAEDNATAPAEEQESGLNESSGPELEANSSEELNQTPFIVSDLENKTTEAENETTEVEDETEEDDGFDVVNVTNETEVLENETETEVTEATNETPSITPDRPVLWGLKRAIEKLDMLITLGNSAKAQKGLVHARERLLEVQAMIAAKKLDGAEKSANAYKSTMEEVQKNVDEIGNGNSTADLEKVIGIETQVIKNELEIGEIQKNIKQKSANVTIEQKAEISALLASVLDTESQLKVSVAQKKNKIEVKIKATGAEKKVSQETRTEEGSEKAAGKTDKNQTRTEQGVQNQTSSGKTENKGKK